MGRQFSRVIAVITWGACALLLSPPAARAGKPLDPDQSMERFLATAKVVKIHRVMSATTYPMALELQLKRESHRAAFKYGHGLREVPASDGGGSQSRVDSYRHEVAAYRLDRALGLRRVPVAVLREVNTPGAVIEWVAGAVPVDEAAKLPDCPSEADWLAVQEAEATVFDALIDNVPRSASDRLVTTADWRLHLIDHSLAFGNSVDVPRDLAGLSDLPIVTELETLSAPEIRSLLGDLLEPDQVEALLERRKALLEAAGSQAA